MTCMGVELAVFETWYSRTHPMVIGVVFAVCGDPDVSADAADEAFTRALVKMRSAGVLAAPDAWVCKVALNVMRRRLRRRSVEARLLNRPAGREAASMAVSNPEVWTAVRALPERQRLAIVLRYVGDMTEADIASVMGVTRGTVAASLAAARTRLRDLLDEPGPDPDRYLEVPHA